MLLHFLANCTPEQVNEIQKNYPGDQCLGIVCNGNTNDQQVNP